MKVSLRWRSLDELDASDLQVWTALSEGAEPHSNPFAMPQFVLPASRWLTPSQPPRLAWIEQTGAATRQLIAVGVFSARRPNLFVPLPHLREYRTLHTPRGGLLVAAGCTAAAVRALLDSICKQSRWHVLDLRNFPLRGEQLDVARQMAESQGGGWFQRRTFARPILDIYAGGSAHVHVESTDRRRRRRRLGEKGVLEYRLLQGAQVDGRVIADHLRLEHAGWKGERGSSLQSSPAQAAFFHEMIAGFVGIGAAAFMETRLDDQVIASSSNLLLGDTLNGIKIGWDPAFATFSPGRINESELHKLLPEHLPQVKIYDSQSQEHSYLADMLPQRMEVVTGTLVLNRGAARAMRAARWLRPLAWRLQRDD